MRTKNSIRNAVFSGITNVITIIIGFIAQAIFIKTLGSEYLGLNGLFNNIISMLAITESGIGVAIIYSLYKPLAEKNKEKIKSLMSLYKKSYYAIAFITLIIGLLVIPFLGIIVKETTIPNITNIYLLFLVDSFCSYMLSYKRSILIADQKNYVINIVHICYIVILNALQIAILLITKNFYLYLILKIVFRVLENIVITLIVNKQYNYLKENNINKLEKNDIKSITTRIKALFIHKIGSFVVLGTDNILISYFFGLKVVGLYSNYYLIIYSVSTLFTQMFSSITSSIGNLIVEDNKEKTYEVYKQIKLINVVISIFTGTAILLLIKPFISIWIGSSYLLNTSILIVLVLNYYLQSTRNANTIFKEAAGIFYEDRYIPIIESLTNIIFSIVFAKIFGLIGIFMGTICSNLVLHLYSYPKYVYKKLFGKNYWIYLKENIAYFILFMICASLAYVSASFINIDNNIMSLIVNLLLSTVIPFIIMYISLSRTDSYKSIKRRFDNKHKNYIISDK